MNSLSEEIMTAAVIEKTFVNETKEQTELEKLIADSIAARDAKIAKEEAEAAVEEARYDAIFHSLLEGAVEAVKPLIPEPLRPYVLYDYCRPSKDLLDARTWAPTTMHIKHAPKLEEIAIHINWYGDGRGPEIYTIVSGASFEGDEWGEAICAAHDRYHNRRAEYSKAARALDY